MSGTVLRYIKGAKLSDVLRAVSLLPYKVEIKQHIKEGRVHYIMYTLPDHMRNEPNYDVDQLIRGKRVDS